MSLSLPDANLADFNASQDLFIHIPESHLPLKLGGQNSWKWEYPPIVPGENAAMEDTGTRNVRILRYMRTNALRWSS